MSRRVKLINAALAVAGGTAAGAIAVVEGYTLPAIVVSILAGLALPPAFNWLLDRVFDKDRS